MQQKQKMNPASQWRLAMARKVAPIIATNPKVQAVILAGSTSPGWADSYSDIEIGVFWTTPPSDEERMAPIAVAGGVFWELDPCQLPLSKGEGLASKEHHLDTIK